MSALDDNEGGAKWDHWIKFSVEGPDHTLLTVPSTQQEMSRLLLDKPHVVSQAWFAVCCCCSVDLSYSLSYAVQLLMPHG